MSQFTPISALVGGAMIGGASVLLLASIGRVAGISGIAGGLLTRARGERGWRLLFVLGLALGAGLWIAWSGFPAPVRSGFPVWLLAASGLLVGYGTAMSNGCTSGHGVCGLARFSVRSLAATATFLSVAIATTFIMRHVLHVGS